jgi:prepilin-type N-terminal cleavage/methylation domain-containing protein
MRRRARGFRGGFSLVEVALALLVVGVGLLAVFGLFPTGMDANRRAVQETQMALFADYVMDGFRALASAVPWSEVAEDNGAFYLEVPAPDMWSGGGALRVMPGEGMKSLVYTPVAKPDIEEISLRYEVRIGLVDQGNPLVKFIRVRVWPGAYGKKAIDGLTFYSELYAFRK